MSLSGPANLAPAELRTARGTVAKIVGNGEMAELVRNYDWASTSLGPIEGWSKELIAIVNLTLCSPAPARTLWGPDLVLIYNDPCKSIPGKRHPDAFGKPAREVYKEAWHIVGPLLENALATGETFRFNKLLVPIDTGHGVKDFCLDDTFSPIYENGRVAGLFGLLRDVTGEVAATRELRESEARAARLLETALLKSEKLAAVGRLASSIAHEINNPLESVMNLIYLARHAGTADTEKYLSVADQEIRRASIIANQTLRFQKQGSKPQAATSADLFSTVMSIHEGRIRTAQVRVEKRFRTDQPVICFQGDVRQVLNNLVGNALEAMPLGGRLLIRSRNGRDWSTERRGLVLTVADNGTGIPPEVKKNIFDAFFTTKGTAGNGLGLWVCREIVDRHQGKLCVRSTQRLRRNGTVFTLFLPFEPASA